MNTFNQSSVLHSNLPHQGGEPVHWPSVVHSLMLSPIMRPSPVQEYLTVVPGEKLTPSDQSEMALIRPATGKPGKPQSKKKLCLNHFSFYFCEKYLLLCKNQYNEMSRAKINGISCSWRMKKSTNNEKDYWIAQFSIKKWHLPWSIDGTRCIISTICCIIKITESQID